MTGRRSFAISEGWVARGWRSEVDPTTPYRRSAIAQHFGARRLAYNWALARKGQPGRPHGRPDGSRRWHGVSRPFAATGTRPSTRSPRGGGNAPRRPTPVGSRIWSRRCTTGRRLSTAAAGDDGSGSLGSGPAAVIAAGSASPPVRCALRLTGAPRRAGDRPAPVQGEHPAARAVGRQGPGADPVDHPHRAWRAVVRVDHHHRRAGPSHPQPALGPLRDRPWNRAGVGGHRP
jgi:hypothetical protein